MGCPSLYVWALVAAAYTTVQSFGFIALNIIFILINVGEYDQLNGFLESVSHYLILGDSVDRTTNITNCTAPEGVVGVDAVAAYQYIYIVFHALWIIAGVVILSQLCRKTRAFWDYLMWMVVTGIVILLDTVTGIFFVIERTSMTTEDECAKAAFWMICLSFRWFIFYILNIACMVVVALPMARQHKEGKAPQNIYMDPPTLRKGLQPKSQDQGPPRTNFNKSPATLPIPIEEHNYLADTKEIENEAPNQFGPGNNEGPGDEIPNTTFQLHSPNERPQQQQQQLDYLPQTMPLDMYPSDPQQDERFSYPIESGNNVQMPNEELYPFSYHDPEAARRGHEPRRSLDQDGQPFERFGVYPERQGDFARNQFDDGQHQMHPHPSRHGYDNPAWIDDSPYEDENPMKGSGGPPQGHRPPPRVKRNVSNRQKRVAPQPTKTPTEDNIEEEKEKTPQSPKSSLAPPSTFDARPFSYLKPGFRPVDHGDVKAMKSHTADIIKTLDQEMKLIKDKEMLSEASDSDHRGIISSSPVRSFLNDSGRRQNVKRSSSLREQLARSGKAGAVPRSSSSVNKNAPNRPNGQRDLDVLGPIDESDSRRPEARPQRRNTDDSARPSNAHGENARRPRGAQQRLHRDKNRDRKQGRRDQTEDTDEDDYDDSDYEDDEEELAGRGHPQMPVFITAV